MRSQAAETAQEFEPTTHKKKSQQQQGECDADRM